MQILQFAARSLTHTWEGCLTDGLLLMRAANVHAVEVCFKPLHHQAEAHNHHWRRLLHLR